MRLWPLSSCWATSSSSSFVALRPALDTGARLAADGVEAGVAAGRAPAGSLAIVVRRETLPLGGLDGRLGGVPVSGRHAAALAVLRGAHGTSRRALDGLPENHGGCGSSRV